MSFCKEIVEIINKRLDNILALRTQFTEKEDGSYVSKGDLLIQEIVFDYFQSNLKKYEMISEEIAPFKNKSWNKEGSFIVLDPIDGTENFVSGLREWGIGISIYKEGNHQESCIFLPELNDFQITGMPIQKYNSRIIGLSSSLQKNDISNLPTLNSEFRIIGCSMYNTLSAVRGSFYKFENVKGVNCWDILPGLNLALEHGCDVKVDGRLYNGQILFPTKKYKISITNQKK
jgi:myo-inositol-1(or 4)-monophosphatase